MEGIISDDVKYLKHLINKKVEVSTIDGRLFSGSVYVVDPVTKCIIISDQVDKSIRLIFEHGIKSMEICETEEQSDISIKSSLNITEEDHKRRADLKEWLNKHCINVEDDGRTLKLGNDLVIECPYDKQHCFSGNIIILERVRTIIDNMQAENK